MMDLQRVLAVGAFDTQERLVLAEAAAQSALEMHIESDPSQAAAWLDKNNAIGILADGDMPDCGNFALERRAEAKNAALPVLTWTRPVTDLSFAEAFSWGADDVVNRSDPYA